MPTCRVCCVLYSIRGDWYCELVLAIYCLCVSFVVGCSTLWYVAHSARQRIVIVLIHECFGYKLFSHYSQTFNGEYRKQPPLRQFKGKFSAHGMWVPHKNSSSWEMCAECVCLCSYSEGSTPTWRLFESLWIAMTIVLMMMRFFSVAKKNPLKVVVVKSMYMFINCVCSHCVFIMLWGWMAWYVFVY